MRRTTSLRRVLSGATALLTAFFGGVFVAVMDPTTAAAATSTTLPRPPAGVTADALPTVQIDGIIWNQAINGNTVYAGGEFENTRPAGAAAGVNQTPQRNLLAYDITTGNLIQSFKPQLGLGVVKALAVSPDGKRLYVGGSFTSAGGAARSNIAAYDTATGALVSSFAPSLNATVTAIVATNTTVYAGGYFGLASGNNRLRLAAFQASNGNLTTWAPTADYDVTTMVMSPDQSKIVIGGGFQNINGQPAQGVAAVSASTGVLQPWPVNTVIHNGNAQSGIYRLSVDNDTIYGTNYNYGTGNYEGLFAMNQDGSIKWLADCHGDTYSAFSVNGIVYGAGHSHNCANIGSFPELNPRWENRLMAFTKEATGTVLPNSQGGAGYGDFAGQPSPSVIDYFPAFTIGKKSGQSQAVWSLTGNGTYLAAAGEFPSVSGVAQQGLVRFAIPSVAPKKIGPSDLGGTTNPTVSAIAGYGARVSWKLNWDRDSDNLTYKVVRSDKPTAPVYTTSMVSYYWQRPIVSFTDKTAQPGQTYRYRIIVNDADGNGTQSDYVSVTMPAGSLSDYAKAVIDDGATNYWRLDDADQSTMVDLAGANNLTKGAGVTPATDGSVNGDANKSASFDGTSAGAAGETVAQPGPTTFSAETWFKTTSSSGGKLLGFGNNSTGTSGSYDRHVYMDNSGRLTFGVYPGAVKTITSGDTYNDGQWHHVVAELSPSGMSLWIDGIQQGNDVSVTDAQPYNGYWRLGGDNLGGWPTRGSSDYFAGQLDETAIYPTVLTATQIRDHYTKSGRTIDIPGAPTDAYGQSVYADNPTLFWRLNDTNGPTIKDSGANLQRGLAAGGVTYGTASPVSGATGTAATFNGSDGTIASQKQFGGPSAYSEELWFNTTTDQGGKLVGFGDAQSGYSTNYDRHVYMESSGQLTFGTWTGQTNLITSPASYNDGAWHQLVAAQGADGMKLWVDGVLVGTNPQTAAQPYNGYWRVGGDTSWGGGSGFFAGSIDEVAVYPTSLSAAQVRAHYLASPAATNAAPVAAFTSNCVEAACTFDAATSSDPDGSVVAWSWDFGSGATASGAQASRTFAKPGTYPVKLTVTDDRGKSASITTDVTVTFNQSPTAEFTSSCTERTCDFDGSSSTDPDGTIASYTWNFGDGTSATGATVTHPYAADGTYPVSLTVEDDQGKSVSVSHTVTAKANQKPTASFTASPAALQLSVDGSASTDADGSVASYDWDFGDGKSATGATASHTYTDPGTYTVKLTVTDDKGATDSVTKSVTISRANQSPTAAFAATVNGLSLDVDGSTSTDPDGSVAKYAWNFGDGGAATGASASHTFASAGDKQITLTVTDDKGATDSVTKTVTVVKANQKPTAAFTSTAKQLAVTFDGSTSSDSDGTVASYAWTFGDGGSATGAKPSYTFKSAGTYQVQLTVTDDEGATDSVTKAVTVTTAPVAVAADSFDRTVTRWGTADVGGAWTLASGAAFSTNGRTGDIKLAAAGSSATASLDAVSAGDVTYVVDLSVDKVPAGSGLYTTLMARKSGTSFYALKVRWMPDNTMRLAVSRTVGGTETTLREVVASGVTYAAGDVYRVKFAVAGTSTSTITGKLWKATASEPANAQITQTDSTAALQAPGGVGISTYLSGGATNAPLVVSVNDLRVTQP